MSTVYIRLLFGLLFEMVLNSAIRDLAIQIFSFHSLSLFTVVESSVEYLQILLFLSNVDSTFSVFLYQSYIRLLYGSSCGMVPNSSIRDLVAQIIIKIT